MTNLLAISKKLNLFLALGLMLWISAIVTAPILVTSENNFAQHTGEFIYFFFSPTCHQIPERSFFLFSEPLAVCMRCFAFYLGALLTSLYFLGYPKIRDRFIHWYLLFFLPAFLDFIAEKIFSNYNLPEFIFLTGIFLGIGFTHIFVRALTELRRAT